MFRLAYDTHALPDHRPHQALQLIDEIGFEAAVVTPDAGRLDLFDLDAEEVARVRSIADELGLELAVATDAPFLVDHRRRRAPSLIDPDSGARERRAEFLRRAIDLAADLEASSVTISGAMATGPSPDREPDEGWEVLCTQLLPLLKRGRGQGVQIVFEPTPGTLVADGAGYDELVERLGPPGDELGWGVCVASNGEGDAIAALAGRLLRVRLNGEALFPAESGGSPPFPPVAARLISSLLETGYDGVLAAAPPVGRRRDPAAARAVWAALQATLTG